MQSRRTKIVATLGPASHDIIAELVKAGVNMFRLNFSHGDHEVHRKTAAKIREVETQMNVPIAILADMQGPKLRIGTFKEDRIDLEVGQTLRFDLDETPGDKTRVCLPHPEIIGVLDKDNLIYLDDGKVRARITDKGENYLDAEILAGSHLSNRKGVNVPDTVIPIPALTAKDRKDLVAALDMDVDWIAQSFVQTPQDVAEARKLMSGTDGKSRAALMVKIEKPSALQKLDDIIDMADGVMLARGDLGVEIPPEDVPGVQKRVVRKVRNQGKPVVVATQMLESMIDNPRPTRAEASDVATAVYDGADAVMLSAETAAGKYPLESVEIMARLCWRTEHENMYQQLLDIEHPDLRDSPSDAITRAAYHVAHDVNAAAIVTYTESGSTALRMARQRPSVPILCITPNQSVARRLSVSYGIRAIYTHETADDFQGPARLAAQHLLKSRLAQKGERFVMTAGVPFGVPGSTNTLRIAWVE